MEYKIICLIGPSGAGKTTIAEGMASTRLMSHIASYTTRPMRNGEENGREHRFVADYEANKQSVKTLIISMNCSIKSSLTISTMSLFLSEFEDKEDVEALVAFCKLRKLRKDWVGVWKPDWKNKKQWKFSIISDTDKIEKGIGRTLSRSLSFPTEEMRDEFIETFKDLLEIAKPLL